MNAKLRIRELMADRQWSEYRLALESGLSQSTISNIFSRNKMCIRDSHDTVQEMARDEARHGKAFEGMLKRYFGK